MKTTTEEARELRKELKKKLNVNSRQVSVRSEYFSMGSSIDVRVKDPEVSLPAVREIASKYESIRRCEITHEILSGGNTYLSVEYTREALDKRSEQYRDAVQAAVDKLPEDSNQLERVEGTEYWVGRRDGRFSVWGEESHISAAYDVDNVCSVIAEQ
jgi:hypothetical protein